MKTFLNNLEAGDLLPGVVAVDNLAEWFWDEVYSNGINVDEWRFSLDFSKEHGHPPEDRDWDGIEFDEPTWLVGDWRLDENDEWNPYDGTDRFSAVLQWMGGAAIATVAQSAHYTRVARMCSPCCPGQANLDSGYDENGYTCYSFPENWYRKEGE